MVERVCSTDSKKTTVQKTYEDNYLTIHLREGCYIKFFEIDVEGLDTIVLNGKKRYVLNLTNHSDLIIIPKEIKIEKEPLLQARIIGDEIRYYHKFGINCKILKLRLKRKIIKKFDPVVIKIVSYPIIEFLEKRLNIEKDLLFKRYGWINPKNLHRLLNSNQKN
jgi:hypothetical protein